MRLCVNGVTGPLIYFSAHPLIKNQLILCRIFQRARLFLLPTLRLRLGFAICYSNKNTEIFIANCFYALVIYDIMNKVASKKYKLISNK